VSPFWCRWPLRALAGMLVFGESLYAPAVVGADGPAGAQFGAVTLPRTQRWSLNARLLAHCLGRCKLPQENTVFHITGRRPILINQRKWSICHVNLGIFPRHPRVSLPNDVLGCLTTRTCQLSHLKQFSRHVTICNTLHDLWNSVFVEISSGPIEAARDKRCENSAQHRQTVRWLLPTRSCFSMFR
jgi:hypothetical protein